METVNGTPVFYAPTRSAWRQWLEKNGLSEKSVWLIIYHKKSKTTSVQYEEAIEESLCFGWIDSKATKRDEESYYLLCTQRKPTSHWSIANKKRAGKMIKTGAMRKSGQAFIDLAKKNGTWEALDNGQNAVIPGDLKKLFTNNKIAYKNFQAFSPSSKRIILEWILKAKKPETRQQRILQTVELAAANKKANHR